MNWETATLNLPYERPPLTANQRMHWAEKARITKRIRNDVAWLMKSAKLKRNPLEPGQKLHVQLTYTPKTNRRRDTDNLWPTLKAICDGLVDAGLVPDDTPEFMDKPQPIINPANKRCRNRISIQLTVHT